MFVRAVEIRGKTRVQRTRERVSSRTYDRDTKLPTSAVVVNPSVATTVPYMRVATQSIISSSRRRVLEKLECPDLNRPEDGARPMKTRIKEVGPNWDAKDV